MSTTRAPAFFSSVGTKIVDTCVKMPTTRLPTSAPKAVPRPPRVTPANTSSRIWKPSWKLTCWASASRMPASPASPAPAIQTVEMTRSTSMPDDAASAGLSETARVALPMRVRSRAYATASSIAMHSSMLIRSLGASETGPRS